MLREHTALYVCELLVECVVACGGVLPEDGAQRDGRLLVINP